MVFFLSSAENPLLVNGSSPTAHLMQLSPTQTLSPLKTRRMRQGLSNSEPQLKTKQDIPGLNHGWLYYSIFCCHIYLQFALLMYMSIFGSGMAKLVQRFTLWKQDVSIWSQGTSLDWAKSRQCKKAPCLTDAIQFMCNDIEEQSTTTS